MELENSVDHHTRKQLLLSSLCCEQEPVSGRVRSPNGALGSVLLAGGDGALRLGTDVQTGIKWGREQRLCQTHLLTNFR